MIKSCGINIWFLMNIVGENILAVLYDGDRQLMSRIHKVHKSAY